MDVGNLISSSSALSKSSLIITVHILLEPGLENFDHYFTSVWGKCNCVVVWTLFAIAFLWNWNKNWPFPVLHCWVFQICYHTECITFKASSFRIWNSLTGILSPLLTLFVVMFPKAHLTSHSRMSGSRWVITPSWLTGSWRSFCILLCFLAYLLLLLSPYHFCPLLCPLLHELFPWYL